PHRQPGRPRRPRPRSPGVVSGCPTRPDTRPPTRFRSQPNPADHAHAPTSIRTASLAAAPADRPDIRPGPPGRVRCRRARRSEANLVSPPERASGDQGLVAGRVARTLTL